MRFHNRAIDQVQTVARFCRESIENTLPHPSPRPAVEPIVRTRVRAIAFGQIAPRDPGPQHVKYCIYDPSIVRARALPTLRHQRLKNRPFLIAEIESHDPPPPAVNHDPCCLSVNYAGTDPSVAPRRLSFGRAARGSVAPRKMACRPAAGERIIAVQGHRPALEGQLHRCPSNREREWTPRRATLLCSPPCHSSAQASPGFGVTLFWVRSFLCSVESR